MELITRTLELLTIEHDTELSESLNNRSNCSIHELQLQGLCLSKLLVVSIKTGLFGRTLIKLKKEFTVLPPHKLSPGDIVGIFTSDIKNPDYSATVYKVSAESLVLACDESIDFQEKVSVVMLANDATYKRQKEVMQKLGSLNRKEFSYKIAQILLGYDAPRFKSISSEFEFFNKNLNEFQQNAVKFALDYCLDVAVIHGPPGTGKTTTIIEIILQAVKRGIKVLATAPSNIAVDNMVEKLSAKAKVVRIGHPARILPSVSNYSFDYLIKHTDQHEIQQDISKEISKLSGSRNNRNEINALRKELKQRDKKAGEEVLERAEVVLATCISAGKKILEDYSKKIEGFGLVIIDEAAQGLECACWVPVLLGTKVILAGDHKQLPPTIISEVAAEEGLKISLMERICGLIPNSCFLLEIQYRMHEDIMFWSNKEFYDSRLKADESVRLRLLESYPHPLILIDTSGGGVCEAGELSKYNPGEAEIVSKFCEELISLGITDISVVTPYNAQVDILKKLLNQVEVATVDGFQGREKDAIVISMVRSNDRKEVGFLKEFRRLNVAVTRAKMLLCIVMDCDTVGGNNSPEFLKTLCQYFQDKAFCINFQEYSTGGVSVTPSKIEKKIKKEKKKPEKKFEKKEKKIEEKKEKIENLLENTKKKILEFVKSDDFEYKTEKLDGKERHSIHELCQSLQLHHKTTGSGKAKCMIISKIFPKKEPTEKKIFVDEASSQSSEPDDQPALVGTKISNTKKKTEEYDENEFLEKAIQESNNCMYNGCSKNIGVIKIVCKFCFGGFCVAHGQAEVHGCGDNARSDARYSHRNPKINDEKLSQLKNKIKEKINLLENRKPKTKKKKK